MYIIIYFLGVEMPAKRRYLTTAVKLKNMLLQMCTRMGFIQPG